MEEKRKENHGEMIDKKEEKDKEKEGIVTPVICRCPNKQLCSCNLEMILEALLEYNRIYDTPEDIQIQTKHLTTKPQIEHTSTPSSTYECPDEVTTDIEDFMINIRFFMRYKLIAIKDYPRFTSIHQLKYDFSNIIQLPLEHIQLYRWHQFLDDRKTLEYLNPRPGQQIDIVAANTSGITPCQLMDNVVPDVINVRVVDDAGDSNDIVVEIEDRSIQKPFLGGYSHKESGVEYHHAESQTGPKLKGLPPEMKNHRDTQTYHQKNRLLQQSYSRGTQMSTAHTWIPTVHDIIKTARPYETVFDRESRLDILEKVIIIQRYFRAWKTRKMLKTMHLKYLQLMENKDHDNMERVNEFMKYKISEINAKTFPRTRDDFRMLYSMVDRWKRNQIDRISKHCAGPAKISEFHLLLDREVEMLTAIEKHRQRVRNEMKDVKLIKFFKSISEPVQWNGYKNKKIAMETLETQQGREYKQIFYEACDHTKTKDSRLVFLRYLREKYLTDHNCTIGNQILKLIDREEQLLNHGIHENHLDILRKRIEQLLLKHMKTPECNKGVTKRMQKTQLSEYKENSSFCPRCNQIKSNNDFPPMNTRALAIRSCISCTWYDKVEEPWYEIGPYRIILGQIRRDERKRNNHTSVAYIIQEKDIHYIVQRIWHARSMICESTDLSMLRLCRWNREEEWSPWNTILLTVGEKECHLEVPKLEEVYDEEFRLAVMDKNLLGRVIFYNALMLNNEFSKETSVEDSQNTSPELETMEIS